MRHFLLGTFSGRCLLVASILLFLQAEQLGAEIKRQVGPTQMTADFAEEPVRFEVRKSLIAWLALTSTLESDLIADSLNLNRGLGNKKCDSPIGFTFTTSNKRLIKADCQNTWRRFIKMPASLVIETTEDVGTERPGKALTEVLTVIRDRKKGDSVGSNDLKREFLTVENDSSLALELDETTKLIASRNLNAGEPLLLSDILVGKNVLTAKTTIPSGSTLTPELAGIEVRFRDIPSDALTRKKGWAFMETNKNIMAGEVLRKRHLRKAKLLRRNDPVTLINTNSTIQIIASGTAVQDGYYGQRVKVINTESGRFVLGTVIGHGRVEINSDKLDF
ncbi:flagellar basal body P-ring formation chaperone FlgA [Gammaproteobacteria bacterium]|nr:flagellar basal body P-ring formation chaperone FlgA [Gammaproteobacteria bacterium]